MSRTHTRTIARGRDGTGKCFLEQLPPVDRQRLPPPALLARTFHQLPEFWARILCSGRRTGGKVIAGNGLSEGQVQGTEDRPETGKATRGTKWFSNKTPHYYVPQRVYTSASRAGEMFGLATLPLGYMVQ